MMRRRVPIVAPVAFLLAAALLAACGQSPRDRYFEARASVHRPVNAEPAPARPVVAVPVGLD